LTVNDLSVHLREIQANGLASIIFGFSAVAQL
jgi:hypothetical protein